MSGEARILRGDNGQEFTLIGPVAYQGKPGCQSVVCTHNPSYPDSCFGWHCVYCDQPCSSQGHRCDAADAILGEAERLAGGGDV